jgi:hypothetical protein
VAGNGAKFSHSYIKVANRPSKGICELRWFPGVRDWAVGAAAAPTRRKPHNSFGPATTLAQ